MKSKYFLGLMLLTMGVRSAFALPCSGLCFENIKTFIENTNTYIVATAGMLFLAVAVVGFFLGIVRFIWAQQQGEQKGIDNGKALMKWGILALFCAFSIYGIIQFAQSTLFGTSTGFDITPPRIIIAPSGGANGSGAGADSSGKPEIYGGSGAGARSSGKSETYNGSGAGSGSSGSSETGGKLSGACTVGIYQGSWQNGSCVTDYSTPVSTNPATICDGRPDGSDCGNGKVCKTNFDTSSGTYYTCVDVEIPNNEIPVTEKSYSDCSGGTSDLGLECMINAYSTGTCQNDGTCQ
jgi:hypothetical protein